MLTACAFWMMKISTTMRAAVPAISPVRMLLIFVRVRPRAGARGAGGAEPLAEGGGRVLVVPGGAAGSVMGCFLRRGPGSLAACAGSLGGPGSWPPAAAGPRCLFPSLYRKLETSNIFLEFVVQFPSGRKREAPGRAPAALVSRGHARRLGVQCSGERVQVGVHEF